MAYPKKVQVGENIRVAGNAGQEKAFLEEAEQLKKVPPKEKITVENLVDRIDELELRIIDLEEKLDTANEPKRRGRKPKDATDDGE